MGKKIEDIEGIGSKLGEKLRGAGIASTQKLLELGATKKGRAELAKSTGVDEKKILTWVNMADLFRVKGIASQYSEILEAAGVDTVKELRNRNAANLAAKISEVNAKKKIIRALPSEKMIQDWIDQAKALPPIVTY